MTTNGQNSDSCTSWTLTRARPLMDRFLERMRNSGNVRASCSVAGIPRSTAYYWRRRFKTFAAQWDEAKDDAVDALDLEAWKRATEGASDRLLMFLLKAHKPSVYNPPQGHEISGKGKDGAIVVDVTDWAKVAEQNRQQWQDLGNDE